MPAVAMTKPPQAAARRDLYDIGEIPPLGHVPAQVHAWAIRKDRHGPPETAMQLEVLPTWPIGENEVLVLVRAGGVNYNGVWAGLGVPISPLDVHKNPFHIASSDASGIVWACGPKVRRWKVGDEVIVHCNQDDGDDEGCNGGDPLLSPPAAYYRNSRKRLLIDAEGRRYCGRALACTCSTFRLKSVCGSRDLAL